MAEPFGPEGLPLAEARRQILAAVTPLAGTETLPLAAALGRVAAEPLRALAAVPGFRASIMDGYAIGGAAVPQPGDSLRLLGRSAPAAPFDASLSSGEAVRILTGAPVPAGSGRVLPQELVPSGQRLGPAALGRLASCGVSHVSVTARPRIGLLVSGDELVPPGGCRGPGQIGESNASLLAALLQRLGYPLAAVHLVADEPVALRQALLELACCSDVVVSSGGVSAGDSDWIRPLLAELGTLNFWKLFLKPGRPFAWGELAGKPFFGLPGNPVAAAVTALQLLWPALQRLEGAEPQLLPRLLVRLQAPLRRGAGRPELARASLVVAEDGGLWARVSGSQASSRIGSLQQADLLLEIPAELGALEAGTPLWAQLLRLPLF
ncbi:MAG: molybdopterin molybdotransferase MoeA [Synechococcaceae cyanobacterium]